MDKISELLAEAGPLYRKRRKARQFAAGTLCSLLCGVWFGAAVLLPERAAVLLPERAADETQLEAYYAALYESDGYFTYGVAADDVLPLDGYGFYEVS